MKTIDFIKKCIEPGMEFSAMPFWFINDDIDYSEIKRQLKDFKDKGIYGVVVHPRMGLPKNLSFLSEDYFSMMCYIADAAADLDMKIILYDEGMYPSGSAQGKVAASNPDFASWGIALEGPETGSHKPEKIFVLHVYEDGKRLAVRKSGGTIRGLHFGEDDGEPDAPLAADILNPLAVDKFIELVYDGHYKHLKDYFGSTIIGFFTDEPEPLGRNVRGMFEWTPGLESELIKQGGKIEELRALFDGGDNKTAEIYRKMVRKRFNEVYYKKLSLWCEKHGIALTGHPAKSDDIDEQKYFQIPGQDLVYSFVSPQKGGINGPASVLAKCSADAARHLGRRRNANEFLGVCVRDGVSWYLTAADMKWFIDWLGVRGVNFFIPHAFYYSLRGPRKDERPPDVGPGNIWWAHYKLFVDYMRRVSYIMTDSKNCADIAVICESGQMPSDALAVLYENQIEFNYLTRELAETAQVVDGKITVAGYTYSHVLDAKSTTLNKDVADIMTNVRRDFCMVHMCSNLRATGLLKDGKRMYFLFNEGSESISAQVYLPVDLGKPIAVDLWRGLFYSVSCTNEGDKICFDLELGKYESILIILDKDETQVPSAPIKNYLGDFSSLFSLQAQDEERYTKTYTCIYTCDKVSGGEYFAVEGEEMAECFVNGRFAGVSFISPHMFHVEHYLKEGDNRLEVVMTGSIANKYGGTEIPYGIFGK